MEGIPIIQNDIQDKNSEAWLKLCDYVDHVAENNIDEFSPCEYMGEELFSQIHTLPETIDKLTKVKKMWLYGSSLKCIPPEIGKMESLEYFDPYTSYDLHWFPYEITKCKKLKDSRVSTRVLYGNIKNRMTFPSLDENPVRYSGATVACSVCSREMDYHETNQVWISLYVGTDTLPLLVNTCSKECESQLPTPPENYIPHPHKGGPGLMQPPDWGQLWRMQRQNYIVSETTTEEKPEAETISFADLKPLKLIRKIWDK